MDFPEDHASRWGEIPQEKLTPENRTHIGILCIGFGVGVYNLPINWKRVEFGKTWTFFNVADPQMATVDNSALTKLVFAAHDACVRLQIKPKTFRHVEIGMHSGRVREGGWMSSHPTVETAVEMWRLRFPNNPSPASGGDA